MIRLDECAQRESADTEEERLEKKNKKRDGPSAPIAEPLRAPVKRSEGSTGVSSDEVLLSKKCSNDVKTYKG